MGAKEAGNILIKMRLETAELKAGIASAQRSLKSLSTSAQSVGKSLSLAFTLPLAGLGATAVKSFAGFDSAMTRSIAIMGKAGQTMKTELVKGAEDVAKSTKFSATEAAEGYYFLAAAGLKAEAAIKALPVVARFATNANIGMAQASDQLVDTLNAVGLASKDADVNMQGMVRVSNVLTRAAMDTNVSISDLASSFAGPLGGSMRQNHIEIETAAAALEALGQQGVKAKVAGTALGIVIRELGLKAVKNADAFKAQGIEVFDSAGKFRNFIDIMGDLEKRLKGVSDVERINVLDKLGFTLKNIGFVTMFLGLTDKMKEFEAANKEANYEAELFAENMKSFANQFAIIKNQLQIVANQIGADLAPAILNLGKAAVKAAEWFKALPEGTRKAIEGFLAFIAIAGPITFFFGNLGAAVLGFTRLLAPLVVWLAKTAAGFLGVQLAAIAIPALIIGAFAAAGAAIYLFWDDIKEAGQGVVDWFASEFPNIAKYAEVTWILMRDAAIATWDWIKQTAGELVSALNDYWQISKDGFASAWEGFKTISADIWTNLKAQAQEWATWFASFFPEWVKNAAQKAADGVVTIVNGAGKSLEDAAALNAKMYGAMGKSVDEYADKIITAEHAAQKAHESWNGAANQESWNAGSQQVLTLEQINKLVRERATLEDLNAEAAKEVHQLSIEEVAAQNEAKKAADESAKAKLKSIKEQAKAIDELRDSLSKTINKDSVEDVKEALDSAIKGGVSDASFQALSKQLYDSVYKGYVEGAQDAIEKAGNTQEANDLVNQTAAIKAQESVDDITAKRIEANTKVAEDQAQKERAAYDNSVSYFKGIFSDAIKGGVYDFKAAFQDILVDLAANLAATLGAALGGTSGSSTGIIGDTSKSGSTNDLTGLFQGAMDAYNSFSGTGGAYADSSPDAGMTGPPMENGQMTSGGTGPGVASGDYSGYAAAAGTALSSKSTDKANKSNAGTGATIGAAIGAYWGPIGAQIGAALGGVVGNMFKWGPQNPETLARHAFSNFIETSFAKMGQVSFFGKDGHLKNTKGKDFNFLESVSDFNAKGSENAVSKLNALGNEARGTFYGLGLAMKETLGLTDAVGEHIGAMLAENLGGSVDNARLLFQQLGLSLDDMVEKLVALGRSGNQSWLEIETAIQGVTNAAKPGLEAFADYSGAFQELVESGGRGVAALKGVKDIAQEGIEAGAQSLEQLKGMMLNSGLDAEQVNAYFDAVKNRGINSLKELAAVSDRVGGGIVADMNANSASLAKMWADMGEELAGIKAKIEAIPTDVVTNYKINVTTNVDSNGQKVLDGGAISLPQSTPQTTVPHAKGAIITGPIGFGGNHVMGEAGPEGLLPLSRMGDGSLGVRVAGGKARGQKSGNTIVINAPYAAPGTADQIRRAVMELEPYLTSRAVDKTIKVAGRGGRMGRNFR